MFLKAMEAMTVGLMSAPVKCLEKGIDAVIGVDEVNKNKTRSHVSNRRRSNSRSNSLSAKEETGVVLIATGLSLLFGKK